MKKFVSLLLAALMLLGSVAFAESTDTVTDGAAIVEKEAITDTLSVFGTEKSYIEKSDNTKDATSGQVETELWLQVEASGQIDVTVPLVLVFSTNIDGGSATEPSEYKFTNNSTSRLAVTKIAIDVVNDTTMDLISYNGTMKVNNYGVSLQIQDKENKMAALDLVTIEGNAAEGSSVAPLAYIDTNTVLNSDDAVETETAIEVMMNTGKLNFVTDVEEGKQKGLKLLAITYTVAIDESTQIGSEIAKAAAGN